MAAFVLCGFFVADGVWAQGPQDRPAAVVSGAGAVSGQVVDSTGAMVPSATVELVRGDGSVIASTRTDSAGKFRVSAAAGEYKLRVVLGGFEPVLEPVRVGRAAGAALVVTMTPANVATSVEVNAGDAVDVSSTESNMDTASMSSNDMKTLPILDDDVVTTLSQFLDAGAAGEGGTTLVVDGVEQSTLGIAPSAVESVTINQNPYSAQYRQPGRGQVEIITKSAAETFHGEASVAVRNSALNGTNYFAATKPEDSKETYDGYLTGPVPGLEKTSFLFSTLVQMRQATQQVNATTAPGVIVLANVAAPFHSTNLSMKVRKQINDHHSVYLLYKLYDMSQAAENVGGLTLGTAGYTGYNFDMNLTFHDDDAWAPNKLNQFNILFERNADREVSATQAPAIIVEGAFNGGGAQADQFQTENNPNISDIVSWTVGRHQLKFGVQLPNLGRRVLEDLTNRQGTYTFANLAAYAQNMPVTYSLQQGQVKFITHYDQPGAFFLDEIKVTDRLTVSPGVRYDFQNALPGTMDAVQPKLALAYVLEKDHALVIRAGGGEYMRRVGVNVGQQLARYQYAAERSLLITSDLCYPITNCNSLAAQPPNLFNFVPNIKAPMQGYFGVSVERELTKKSTVTIGYEGYRGWHALQSIDVNAPLPPFTSAARPNSNFAQVLQLHSGGIQRSDALIASFRGRIGKVFAGYTQYTWQHARADTEYSTFQPQNQYAPDDEYGRTNNDERQRVGFFGTFFPDLPVTLGIGFFANTPQPYTETTGTDDYKTGVLNARPAGVPRNSLNGGNYQDTDVRLAYTRKLRPKLKDQSPTLQLSLSSFNTTNRTNYEDYVGVVTSPEFMRPTGAGSPRRLMLGVAYTF